MRRPNAIIRPIVFFIAASLGACMSLPAAAQAYVEASPAAADVGSVDAQAPRWDPSVSAGTGFSW